MRCQPGEGKVVIDNLDPNRAPGHFWKFLAMGPDGKLYFNIGAPGNIVMPGFGGRFYYLGSGGELWSLRPVSVPGGRG